MPLSIESRRYVDRIVAAESTLLDSDVCEDVALGVVKLVADYDRKNLDKPVAQAEDTVLSHATKSIFDCLKCCCAYFGPTYVKGSASFLKALAESNDAVFRFGFRYSTGLNFAHHLAVIKCGTQHLIFQGWRKQFSLRDWLTGKGTCGKKDAIRFSPAYPRFNPEGVEDWLGRLVAFETAAIDKERDDFDHYAETLFCVSTAGPQELPTHVFRAHPFYVWWDKYPILESTKLPS